MHTSPAATSRPQHSGSWDLQTGKQLAVDMSSTHLAHACFNRRLEFIPAEPGQVVITMQGRHSNVIHKPTRGTLFTVPEPRWLPSEMSRPTDFTHCVGSPAFRPEDLIEDTDRQKQALDLLAHDDLYNASRVLLQLPEQDLYTYHAITSVKLAQVQHVVGLGGVNGLHSWYRNEDGSPRDPPTQADIEAYISIFSPATATGPVLKNLGTNAKKGSTRSEVAASLEDKRYLHSALVAKLTIPKCKKPPSTNPYFDFWAWSCRSLKWCGPCPAAERVATSHHILPIFMHHFGCATPSHESLAMLKMLADGRPIADIGSGNGYWAFMLRRYGLTVRPVDNMQSEWRVNWVSDTVISDGVQWLRKNAGGRDMVLLLVYPVVGGGVGGGIEGEFTRSLVTAFQGNTIAVVGTQNHNGYTGFKGMTMDEFMEREHKEWTKVVQIPLPSFAGKNEALYVFQRGERAPQQE
ncbi:hypothetical protein FALBO_10981 [Fusarium albosuccineum]|uniref:Uncharacterized protein n=1 Tax=Fusarium albosuccineum TaxID=1237068 RepID=A0A8H4L4N1_9HYPO|nr:hypothetical protein FALBO_10981 [Fusarium albosuccineum]